MINDRRQLADVYQQTIDIVLEGHYTSENGEKVKLPDNTKMLKGSRFYTSHWMLQTYLPLQMVPPRLS